MSRRSPQIRVQPSVIRWVRTSAGWPIRDISKKLNVQENIYRKWESGDKLTTLKDLEALAKYCKRPLAALFLPNPPKEPPPPRDFRKLPKNQAGVFRRETLLAIRRALRSRSITKDLLAGLGRDPKPKIKTATMDQNPEEIALLEREHLGVSLEEQKAWNGAYQAFYAWREKIETNNILVFRFSMPLEDARGFSLSDQNPFAIVISAADAPTAKTFTLFHEYAHLILGTPGICIPQTTWHNNRVANDMERWCNNFAGAFLVPKESLEEHPYLKEASKSSEKLLFFLPEVSSELKVSRQVVLRRMFGLDYISKKMYFATMKILQASAKKKVGGGGGPTAARKCLLENGHFYTSLVIDSHHRGLLTHTDVADYLSLPLQHLEKVAELLGI